VAKTLAALVIDQDVQSRYEMKQVVRSCGLSLAGEAGLGIEAMSTARDTHADLILVAVNEPMERPLQTVESLVSLLPDTPVIVYSSATEIESVRRTMLAGARDFLPRPVKPEMLRDSVLKTMEAAENRRLRHTGESAPATAGTVVTIFGAKGGIGKSTLSTNLAVALAQQSDQPVVIVDLDNGFGDIAGMLDIKPDRTLFDLSRDIDKVGREDLKKYVVRHEMSGLDVLAGPSLLDWRKLTPDDVRRVVELLARTYDKVVLDTAGTLNEISELAVELATVVLWLTTTEFASVRDTIEALRAFQTLSFPQDRMRLVINAIFPDDDVRAQAVQDALQREVFWQIPYDKKIRQGTHLGQPIVVTAPQSVAARSFTDLATVLAGGRVNGHKKATGAFRWRQQGQGVAAAGGS
jgi:pilus assembly protein CpaE